MPCTRTLLFVLLGLAAMAATTGCGHQLPGGPGVVNTGSKGGDSVSKAVPTNLVVEGFTVMVERVGDALIGRPSLRVRETTGLVRAKITRVRFTGEVGTSGFAIRQPPLFVTPGDVLDVPMSAGLTDVPLGSATTSGETTVTVDVSYEDDAGSSLSVSGRTTVSLPSQQSTADVRVAAFTVSASALNGSTYSYLTNITLVESSGKTGVAITRVNFEMLGDGPSGVPPSAFVTPLHLSAGGMVTLDEDSEYGTGITSAHRFPQVRVTISYVDDRGAIGSVQATAAVAWSN